MASLKISPGFAPKALLYPVRVFGSAGSTNVVTEAIDWAIANHMDVINMSLGSNEGYADDPDAVAASNAAAAGSLSAPLPETQAIPITSTAAQLRPAALSASRLASIINPDSFPTQMSQATHLPQLPAPSSPRSKGRQVLLSLLPG